MTFLSFGLLGDLSANWLFESLCLELGGGAVKAEAHLAVFIELSTLWN